MSYQKYADKAFEKIKKYGSLIKVKRAGEEEYDPETNTYSGGGEEFTGYAIQRNFNQRNVDGTNIKYGDVLFMAQLPERPQTNDTVVFGGREYTVINVEPLNPDGSIDIFVNIQAR